MSASARGDRGSVLILMPAAVLIVLLMGSIAFDFSLVYLRQRQATNLAIAAANDAAIAGFNPDAFHRDGTFVLEDALVNRAAGGTIAASDAAASVVSWQSQIVAPNEVLITVTVHVDYVFAKALPMASRGTDITVHASAVADAG
jgi:Flp pilus assembly protein TadG